MSDACIYPKECGSLLQFGPFKRENFYPIEKICKEKTIKDYTFPSVEFVFCRDDRLYFLESKKTAPRVASESLAQNWQKVARQFSDAVDQETCQTIDKLLKNTPIYCRYADDIVEKFFASLLFTLEEARKTLQEAKLPDNIQTFVAERKPFVFMLVVTEGIDERVAPLQDALQKAVKERARPLYELFKPQIRVLSAKQAQKKGIVFKILDSPQDVSAQ